MAEFIVNSLNETYRSVVLQINNKSNTAADFTLFDCTGNSNDGISCAFTMITYEEIIEWIKGHEIQVGAVYVEQIVSSADKVSLPKEYVIKLIAKSICGEMYQDPIILKEDLDKFSRTARFTNCSFGIDSLTTLKLSLPGKSSIQIRFFYTNKPGSRNVF